MQIRMIAATLTLTVASTMMSTTASAQEQRIDGSAAYRERMALPPGAVLQVELLDSSRADAAAVRLSSMAFPTGGRIPITFSLPYQGALIDERLQYTVRAELRVDDRVMFRTTSAYPVLTGGAGNEVDLLLVRASGQGAAAGGLAKGGAAVRSPDGDWVALSIGGEPLSGSEQPSTLSLSEGGARVSGLAGCNRFNGAAKVDGDQIEFGALAMTMMACVPGLAEQERSFAKALGEARRYRLEGSKLNLLSETGDVLVTFNRAR